MSAKHPIIAITGSSGAGTTTTTAAIKHIFRSLDAKAEIVEGDSFHRYTRPEMDKLKREALQEGKHLSYFGQEANDFAALEELFANYGQTGTGQVRR